MLPAHYFDEWKHVREGTRKLAAVVPDDKLDFKPSPDLMPLGELTRHIVGAVYFMLGRWLKRDVKAPDNIRKKEPLNRAAFIAELDVTDKLVQAVLSDLTMEDLDREAYKTESGESRSTGYVVWHLGEHEIHHRAQLKLYLKLLGLDTSALTI
ncbi:MAG: DinB family protein [Spirochaetia bacterium]|nr:DinB family protein [Spirochaetia bacterium]